MAITNPGLVQASEALFGFIRPRVIELRRLGATDFSDGAPNLEIKPGATVKVLVSSVAAASEYNEETNNYLTGGDTAYAQLTATHFLQGYDVKGVDLDNGAAPNVARIVQLFSQRAAAGIGIAASGVLAAALASVTASTGVTLPAAPDYAGYDGLFGQVDALNKINANGSVLAITGSELGRIKAAYHAKGIHIGGEKDIASELGFADVVTVPGATGRLWIIPPLSLGYLARVPAIIADYESAGADTDPETGLSIGIVVANAQATNKKVVNADLWFGCATQSANAAATTAGIVKVGTAAG